MIAQINCDHADVYKLKDDGQMETGEKTQSCFSSHILYNTQFNPSIVCSCLFFSETLGVWSRSQLTLGEGRAPWIRCQFITGPTYRGKQPFTLTFTPEDNLKIPIAQTFTQTKLCTERPCSSHVSNPGPSCCGAPYI